MVCHDCGNESETTLEGQPLCMACVESLERDWYEEEFEVITIRKRWALDDVERN